MTTMPTTARSADALLLQLESLLATSDPYVPEPTSPHVRALQPLGVADYTPPTAFHHGMGGEVVPTTGKPVQLGGGNGYKQTPARLEGPDGMDGTPGPVADPSLLSPEEIRMINRRVGPGLKAMQVGLKFAAAKAQSTEQARKHPAQLPATSDLAELLPATPRSGPTNTPEMSGDSAMSSTLSFNDSIASLAIGFLQAVPSRPECQLRYVYPGLGAIPSYAHACLYDERMVLLVFDRRCGLPDPPEPQPEDSATKFELAVDLGTTGHTLRVMIPKAGLFVLGQLVLRILLLAPDA